MKTVTAVLFSLCLLCVFGGLRAFEAPSSHQKKDALHAAIERAATSRAEKEEVEKVKLEYLYAWEAVNFYREVGRACLFAALISGAGGLLASIVGMKKEPNQQPVPTPRTVTPPAAQEARQSPVRHI
jgi:hypothetical protein